MNKFRLNLIKAFSVVFAVCMGFAITTMPAKAQEVADFSVMQGASIRNGESDGLIGLKFSSSVNDAWLSENQADKYSFGTLLYPTKNEGLFDESKTATENMGLVDASNIIHVQNQSVSAGCTFSASIIYDRQSVIETIEAKGLVASDDLVDSVLKNLYNKDFTAKSYAVVNGETIYTNSYSTSMYKVAAKTYALGETENNESYKTLALNYFESASVKEAKIFIDDGVLVTSEGFQFEYSSSVIVISNHTTLVKDVDYTVSNSGEICILNAKNYAGQTINYYFIENGVLTVVKAEFSNAVLTGIDAELKDLSYTYNRTDDISPYVKFRFAYDDGSYGLWKDINAVNVESISVSGEVATAKITVTYYNKKLSDTVEIKVNGGVLSVTEVLSGTVGESYLLSGIVASFGTTVDQNEVILVDKTTEKYISVSNLGTGNLYEGSYYVKGVDIGYEITIPVTLRKGGSKTGANADKLYAEYVGGSNLKDSVVSKNNQVAFSSDKVVIDSHADLKNFLSTSNRKANVYKTVTLRGEMNFVLDNKYEFYDFWFYDSNATDLSTISIDGLIPTFSNASCRYTTGKSFSTLAFNTLCATNQKFDNPINAISEITALYLGGNSKYAQFVILDENAIKDATPTITSKEFSKPKKLNYYIGEQLDVEGGSITYNYDIRSSVTVDVTENMIKNMPVIDTAGKYTITVSYDGSEYNYEIQVLKCAIKSVELISTPTKTIYTHRDSFDTLDLTGGKLLVTYEDSTSETLDISKDMIDLGKSDEWQIGTVKYVISYVDYEVDFEVVYENTALSISEFKSGVEGETYDVTGIVVGPVSSYVSVEILIKDKSSNEMISIANTGSAGKISSSTSMLNLDTSLLKIGDEVILKAKLVKTAGDSNNKGNQNRLHGDATDKATFAENLVIVSSGNSSSLDLSSATTISTQSDLVNFMKRTDKAYKLVKLCQVKGGYKSYGYLIYFGDKREYVNGGIPLLDIAGSKTYVSNISSYFGNPTASPVSTEYDVYALYVGGNATFFNFMVLDSTWLIKPTDA